MQILKYKTDLVFYFTGFLLTLAYILLFRPVSDLGDAPAYLRYARTIIENGDTASLIYRSPFYPWLLSLLVSVFGEGVAIEVIIMLQYLLVFISIVLLYRILIVVFDKKSPATCAALIVMGNLSVIFYGYMILTETLTLFLLILSIWILLKGINRSSLINLILTGITLSFMILTRFNTLPILVVFLAIIFLLEFKGKKLNLSITLRNLIVFILPLIIILNGYAFLNYQKHKFYGLFPMGGSPLVSRNALIATIDGSEKVSEENMEILNIFMAAEEYVENKIHPERKGSLTRFDRLQITEKLYKGFPVFSASRPELCQHFKINPAKPEPDLSRKLAPFYNEIRRLNKNKVWGIRVLSLLSSFRSSSGLVIPEKPEINLGRLPAWMIIGYKLTVISFSVMVFVASVIYLILCMWKVTRADWTILLFILIIFGFFFINFAFATANDANRFKYPAEPLIISLGVYYIYNAFLYIKQKIKLVRKSSIFHVPGLP